MYHPTTRLLTVLELLQSRPQHSAAELAAHLEVDQRTVRRYVTMLQDLGIPVEAVRGRNGGYRLRPGFKLPPLMFTNGEALALGLGLLLTRRLGLGANPADVVSATAKLERVLPPPLRRQMQAVQDALVLDLPLARTMPDQGVIVVLSTAVTEQRRVRLQYMAWDGVITSRTVDPYGVVYRAGHWYLPGYCHLREAKRTFRLDRIVGVSLEAETFSCPTDFDPIHYVNQTLATTPGIWKVDILLQIDMESARHLIPPALGTLTPETDSVALHCYVQQLDWFAHFLIGLDCSFQVRSPAELRTTLQKLVTRITRIVAEM
jgi:predicted DNA-binding transcriptional regulator YafY